MPKRCLVLCSLILATSACGPHVATPQAPTLQLDRDSIGFGQEFDQATYVGTKPQESLLIQNVGIDTLIIQSAILSGDPTFTLDGPLSNEVKGKDHTFVRIIFSPTRAGTFTSTLTLVSNAANSPQKTVPVS